VAQAEWKRTTDLIDAAAAILGIQQPMTIRQLFYRLVSAGLIPNDRKNYQLVSRIMTKARDDNRIPFEYITDRSRPEYRPNVWDDAAGYFATVKSSYRKNYWQNQTNHVELWVEKDAIIGSIESVTDELGITVRVGRGFLSTTRAHEIAEHFRRINKPITVFYLGDHDPSGQAIETDIQVRVRGYGSGAFELKRLAIFKSDIKRFKLPPLRIKRTDSNAGKFLSKYGDAGVELDALPPDELRKRITNAVEKLIDLPTWERAKATEGAERASIERVAARPMNDTPRENTEKCGPQTLARVQSVERCAEVLHEFAELLKKQRKK